ncbi:MAG: hypothetical protein HC897_16125 [Thermoanaerobaculia bacterium]|nr:hypothetical protein [Thermoanaerobaculia bacterium]
MRALSRTLLILAVVSIGLRAPLGAADSDFKIVINDANPTTSLDRALISKIFLKKSVRWENKERITPIDQTDKTSVRESFSLAIHEKSVAAIKAYWQRMIFSGRDAPPAEEVSDAAVLKLVASNPGAIGYVSKGTTLTDGVKELKITD